MNINKFFMAAGVMAIFTSILHTFSGTLEIYAPLFESTIDQRVMLLLYVCWHIVTVFLILSAIFLILCAKSNDKKSSTALVFFISIVWIASGLVFVVVSMIYLGLSGIVILPQWILLIPVGIVGLLGCRKSNGV